MLLIMRTFILLAFWLGLVVAYPVNQGVSWKDCPPDIGQFQCANFSVPLDWNKPSGERITLAALRIKANTTSPKGSIYFNPGGPGGSAIGSLPRLATDPQQQISSLLGEYDLIAVDPRGVGSTSPIKCDASLWNKRVPSMVSNEDEYNTLVQHWEAIGQSCRNLTGRLFDHLDTVQVAYDFEAFRQANGDEKYNLIGLSYGTQIGYTYAELFPDRVGRMLLDGVVDHTLPGAATVQSESTTYEATLQQFFAWCRQNSTCALHGSDPQAFFEKVAHTARDKPIPAPDCQRNGTRFCQPDVNYEDFLYNIQPRLTFVDRGSSSWARLSQAILEASQGNATQLSTPYVDEAGDPGTYAGYGVGCQDWEHPFTSYAALNGVMKQVNALSFVTQGFTQSYTYLSRCIGWPAKLTNGQRPLKPGIAKAPKMLLVNAYWDPETSIQWAVGMRRRIPNAHLILRNGSGHTSSLLNGDTAKAAIAFLRDGTLPADGTIYNS